MDITSVVTEKSMELMRLNDPRLTASTHTNFIGAVVKHLTIPVFLGFA
jgi:hypothetical protein